jgi:hypothetical protein
MKGSGSTGWGGRTVSVTTKPRRGVGRAVLTAGRLARDGWRGVGVTLAPASLALCM